MVTVLSGASPNVLWLKHPPTVFDKACFTTALKTLRSHPHKLCAPNSPVCHLSPCPSLSSPASLCLPKGFPDAADQAFEIKWDGYRLGDTYRSEPCHPYPWRPRLTRDGGKGTGPTAMILGGEAVVLDAAGRSNFGMLQERRAAGGTCWASHSRWRLDNEPPIICYHGEGDSDTVGPAALRNIRR